MRDSESPLARRRIPCVQTPFTILIDGDCPLCRREAAFLARLDGSRGRLRMIDIAAPGFDAGQYGRTHAELMGTIHGILADGTLVTGMEVFRRAYGAVSPWWAAIWAPTGWPLLRPLFDALYRVFARHRLRLTGRSQVNSPAENACEGGACRMPS